MRKPGFYWVMVFGEWTIGHWYGDYWGQVFGYDDGYHTDDFFQVIDEIKIVR